MHPLKLTLLSSKVIVIEVPLKVVEYDPEREIFEPELDPEAVIKTRA